MATGANTTPLGRLNPAMTNPKNSLGSSLLKPSYLAPRTPLPSKRDRDDYQDFYSTNWDPDFLERERERKRKRRSRWGGDDKDKVFIPGMPTVLPNNLSGDQERAYLLQLQIEEISRRLRTGDLGIPPNPEERSPSPEPIYNSEGKRLNTREYRTRKKLEDDRHYLITEMFKINTDYKPPADYKPPVVKVSEKVMIPQEEHPDINFVGLLIGPRGNTLKAMEKETGAKIIIRGKGSVKEGKVGRKDGQPLPGEDEPLHAFVTANNPESVKKAVEKIREIIRQGVEVPEGQNDLRRMQLRELALLNGTLRENDGPRCSNCGASSHRSWQCPDKPNVTNNVICSNCGAAGHIARDCRERKVVLSQFGTAGDKSKIDEEYMSLMAELGEGPPPPAKTVTHTSQVTTHPATPSPLAAPQGPPRALVAPPPQPQTHLQAAPPPWAGSQPKPSLPTTTLVTTQPPQLQPPTMLPPPPGAAPASQPMPPLAPWQTPTAVITATQPTITIQGVPPPPPPPTMIAPPPPPAAQPQPPLSTAMSTALSTAMSTAVPWLTQQPTLSQGVTVAAGVPSPWQQQPIVTAPLPVPPPSVAQLQPVVGVPAFPWTSFIGVPPPPPGQPPLPPGLSAAPPPPPPPPTTIQHLSVAATAAQAVDLTTLAQAGLPSLLAAPPPPPPN